eukprot:gene8816-7996_t
MGRRRTHHGESRSGVQSVVTRASAVKLAEIKPGSARPHRARSVVNGAPALATIAEPLGVEAKLEGVSLITGTKGDLGHMNCFRSCVMYEDSSTVGNICVEEARKQLQ